MPHCPPRIVAASDAETSRPSRRDGSPTATKAAAAVAITIVAMPQTRVMDFSLSWKGVVILSSGRTDQGSVRLSYYPAPPIGLDRPAIAHAERTAVSGGIPSEPEALQPVQRSQPMRVAIPSVKIGRTLCRRLATGSTARRCAHAKKQAEVTVSGCTSAISVQPLDRNTRHPDVMRAECQP